MPNGDGPLVVLISTMLAVLIGLLFAGIVLGVAKFLVRVDRRGQPLPGDDRDRR